MSELLPCPFCGGKAELDDSLSFLEYYGHERCSEAIQCKTCEARIEVEANRDKCSCCNDLKSEAVALWNRRTPPKDFALVPVEDFLIIYEGEEFHGNDFYKAHNRLYDQVVSMIKAAQGGCDGA